MRWSIIRLIWLRELRDQLRDRRTLFMIVGLPLFLYPLLGVLVLTFALQFFEKPSLIGVVATEESERHFPSRNPKRTNMSAAGAVALIAESMAAGPSIWAAPLSRAYATQIHFEYPPLTEGGHWCGPAALISKRDAAIIAKRVKTVWLSPNDNAALANHKVDLVLRASDRFYENLERDESGIVILTEERLRGHIDDGDLKPTVSIELRPNDDSSRQASQRIHQLLERWRHELKKVRFIRRGIDAAFDDPFAIEEPKASDTSDTEKIADMVIRIFPFMLVMWSLAGALIRPSIYAPARKSAAPWKRY